ncbi:carcinoembryonic antigen-related cell adhesion molecule 1-like [Octodon degus]|uniref:Carcinoembryonic antigen-related cell adhesion molecule 1-like n=1 Tax=Octodon degus TaxID=10160 RepID=A0A6P3VEH1_OCTDE|nr:carcinoembryonic antigen-related cell adhesion molecule 1-like [Octodon degus]
MEPRSATSHRGLVPWQGLLLAALLLTSWTPPATAQVTIEPVPFHAAEGGDVLLLAHNLSENNLVYKWFKGDRFDSTKEIAAYLVPGSTTTHGPAYSDRETIYSNGSLLFKNLTLQDSGVYTLHIIKQDYLSDEASGEFQVHPVLPKPHITSNNASPVEGEEPVVLTCEPETQDTTYLWWTNGQSLQDGDRLKLSNDSRILTLFNVTRNDTGPYECETQNIVSGSRSDPFTLDIYYGPDDPIILPPETYFHPGTTLNLSCHAASNPAAQYHWLIDGSILQFTQELHIPNVSAKNSGSYTCLANNSATGLSRSTLKTVIVPEVVEQPIIETSNTTVEEGGSVVLICLSNDTGISIQWLFNDQQLQLTESMKLSQNSSILTIDPVKQQDAGEYRCECNQGWTSMTCDSEESSGPSIGAIVGIVIGVVAGVALITVLVYCLVFRKIGGASDQHDLTEHKLSVSNHSLGPSDNSPNKVDEIAYSSLNFNTLQPKQSTSDSPPPTVTETVYSEVKKN